MTIDRMCLLVRRFGEGRNFLRTVPYRLWEMPSGVLEREVGGLARGLPQGHPQEFATRPRRPSFRINCDNRGRIDAYFQVPNGRSVTTGSSGIRITVLYFPACR